MYSPHPHHPLQFVCSIWICCYESVVSKTDGTSNPGAFSTLGSPDLVSKYQCNNQTKHTDENSSRFCSFSTNLCLQLGSCLLLFGSVPLEVSETDTNICIYYLVLLSFQTVPGHFQLQQKTQKTWMYCITTCPYLHY